MNYNKPEITSLASATFVIQGGSSKSIVHNDSANDPLMTPNAYEADE
jgi:hypothetical protein